MMLRKITPDGLTAILRSHERWIGDEGGERANLRRVNLRGANLRGANLYGADLSETACFAAMLGKYDVWITPSHTRIGCQYMDNDQWIRLTFDDAETMDKGAREWWSLYRDVVLSMIRSSQRQDWPVRENEVVS